MNTTIKSLITAGSTVIAAVMFYLLRHFPDATPKRTQPESSGIEVPLVETPPCEPLAPAPTPPRPRLRPTPPAVEPAGLTAKKLLDALALMRPLIQRYPTLPIGETVLLEPGQMTVTDLESRLTSGLTTSALTGVLSDLFSFLFSPAGADLSLYTYGLE